MPQAVHLRNLDTKELGNHLGCECRLGGVAPVHAAELLDLPTLDFLFELPLSILLPTTIQIVIVEKMAGAGLLPCDCSLLLDLFLKPGASDVELLCMYRPILALELG